MKTISKSLLVAASVALCGANSLNITLDSSENVNKFDSFMSDAKDLGKAVNLNLKFCADEKKCVLPAGLDSVRFDGDMFEFYTYDATQKDDDQRSVNNHYEFHSFGARVDAAGYVNINANVKVSGPLDCDFMGSSMNCEYKVNMTGANSQKAENSSTCDIVKELNDFCASEKTMFKLQIELVGKINVEAGHTFKILSSKPAGFILEMAKDGANESDCQKAKSAGMCEVEVLFEGVRDGQKASEVVTFEAMISDEGIDMRPKN